MSGRARFFLMACAVGAVSWLASGRSLSAGLAPATSVAPAVSLSPAARATWEGGLLILDVMVDCGANADAAAVTVEFDPAVLQVISVAADKSRFPTVLRNRFDNVTGRVTYDAGAALDCYSEGACPSGVVRLARIAFRTISPVRATVPVTLSGKITWRGEYTFNAPGAGSQLTVTIAGDVTGDCRVDIVDIMLVAARWSSQDGDATYDSRYDLGIDGLIDVADIAAVAGHWGDACAEGSANVRGLPALIAPNPIAMEFRP
jgi:hypothetical protein